MTGEPPVNGTTSRARGRAAETAVLVAGQAARDIALRTRHLPGADSTITSPSDARAAARDILDAGVSVVCLEVEGDGDLVAWSSGSAFLRFGDADVVDPTGAGDAFVAGLTAGLRRDMTAREAGELAHRAAAATVGHLGGRPDLRHLAPVDQVGTTPGCGHSGR